MPTAKKVTKKTVVKFPALNKKNAAAFADRLFTENRGEVKMLKLCDGQLAGDRVGGKQLHCAIGEVYFTFVDTRMPKDNVLSNNVEELTATEKAIKGVVEVAQLKSPTPANILKLQSALETCVERNDDSDNDDNYYERARSVSEVWRKRIVPLLK